VTTLATIGRADGDLASVRAQLDRFVGWRLQAGLSPNDEAEYRRLSELETELLRTVAASAVWRFAG
jgi:hypothetical protein